MTAETTLFALKLSSVINIIKIQLFKMENHKRCTKHISIERVGCIKEVLAYQNQTSSTLRDNATWLNNLMEAYVAVNSDSKEIVGLLPLEPRTLDISAPPLKIHWISGLEVSAAYRGAGIARSLILKASKDLGIISVYCERNRSVWDFYRRCNFSHLMTLVGAEFPISRLRLHPLKDKLIKFMLEYSENSIEVPIIRRLTKRKLRSHDYLQERVESHVYRASYRYKFHGSPVWLLTGQRSRAEGNIIDVLFANYEQFNSKTLNAFIDSICNARKSGPQDTIRFFFEIGAFKESKIASEARVTFEFDVMVRQGECTQPLPHFQHHHIDYI